MSADNDADAALALFDRIERAISEAIARYEFVEAAKLLNVCVGLKFVESIKGKVKKVRRLAGGMLVFGDGKLPVSLHGEDCVLPQPRTVLDEREILPGDAEHSALRNAKAPSSELFVTGRCSWYTFMPPRRRFVHKGESG